MSEQKHMNKLEALCDCIVQESFSSDHGVLENFEPYLKLRSLAVMQGMLPSEHIQEMLRTEKSTFEQCNPRLLHAMMGLVDEAGEITAHLKRYMFYNKPLDPVNIQEELGDMFWYISLMIDELNALGFKCSYGSIMEMNKAKLRKRYPLGFSNEAANNRNLAAEREVLEKSSDQANK